MAIAVKRYYSGMNPGAQALSGQDGTLVSLLDACLKDGFQTKSINSPLSRAVQYRRRHRHAGRF